LPDLFLREKEKIYLIRNFLISGGEAIMGFWEDKKIVVTGGNGFVGRFLVNKIKERGCKSVTVPLFNEFDLRDKSQIKRLYDSARPDIVIHLAARVGGIGANMKYPGEFFYDNLIMGVELMEQARLYQVGKFVAIGTICAYPKFARIPFKESELWNGYPEETNAPYGLAKKMLLVQAQAYRKQYNFNALYLLPVNMYGPGDNFNPESSHVIPAMIRKFSEALGNKQDEVVLWGSGRATREFLYVEDCAEAICLATERYNKSDPVNIGSGFEISISRLAKMIARILGYSGRIVWNRSMPDGQPRRALDVSRAYREFGFKAEVDFECGLRKTIDWYKQNEKSI
jgi:GDP-L-fucose synthase